RSRTHLVGLVADPGIVRDRNRHGGADAGTGKGGPGGCELIATEGQRAARSQRRLRRSSAAPGGNVGSRRRVPVTRTVLGRAAAAFEESGLGRHLDLPAYWSRRRSLGRARQA